MENWAELAEKIKNNQATAEEKERFAAKVAEYRALQDYLWEEETAEELFAPLAEELPQVDQGKIRKAVDRKLLKLVLLVFAVLLALFLLLWFVIKPLAEQYYYNPQTPLADSRQTPLTTYQSLYNEATNPMLEFQGGPTLKTGFAKYQISNYYVSKYADQWLQPAITDTYEIQRGKMIFAEGQSDPFQNQRYYPMYLAVTNQPLAQENQTKVLQKVQELPDSSSLTGFLTFKQPLTIEQVLTFFGEADLSNDGARVNWLSVVNQSQADLADSHNSMQFGMDLFQGAFLSADNPAYRKLNQTYPELFPMAFDIRQSFTAETYQQHYHSLLQYLIDHAEQLQWSSQVTAGKADFQKALRYIEKNGVKINGLYLSGNKAEFLKYAQKSEVLTSEVFATELYSQHY